MIDSDVDDRHKDRREDLREDPREDLREHYLEEARHAREVLLGAAVRCKDLVPGAGRWSAVDNLQHCCIAEKSITGIFLRAERIATSCEPMNAERLSQERRFTSMALADRTRRVEAADRLVPVSAMSFDEVLAALEHSRSALLNAVRSKSDLQLRSLVFAHPIRGDMSLYGWLWFVACHERRHAGQIEQISGDSSRQ